MGKTRGDGARAGAVAGNRWTRERLLAELETHGSAEGVARAHGLSGGTIRNAMRRQGVGSSKEDHRAERSGVEVSPEGVVVSLPPGADLGDIRDLLARRGLDPDEWVIERVTTNEWEALAPAGEVVTLHQLKVHMVARAGVIVPAVEVAQRHSPSPVPRLAAAGELVVVMGDQQAPYHDEQLHLAVLHWLADVEPDRGIFTGDTLDLPTISRHQDRLRWAASTQACVDVGYRLLSDVRDASPETPWWKLRGNHDWRLESELMGRAERMAFLAPALRDGEEREPHLYSIRRLLHLDALGIELAGEEGEDWRYGRVPVTPGMEVRHEPPNDKKAARLNVSIMAGHTHRQGIRHATMYDGDGEPVVRTIVDVGCLCRTREGLGYAPNPDWQAGFATAQIAEDGSVSYDLATWRDGVLNWRGERWT